jgi:hypothetical protein
VLRWLGREVLAVVGWPESANPAVSEDEAMPQPATSNDTQADNTTRYIRYSRHWVEFTRAWR